MPTQCSTKGHIRGILLGDLTAANEARRIKLASWRGLGLRQYFPDENWMVEHIKAAGLKRPNRMEPATVPRLRAFLRRAGVQGLEIETSLGTTLDGYLKRNPDLPLWAAVCLSLEATGRFSPPVSAELCTALATA